MKECEFGGGEEEEALVVVVLLCLAQNFERVWMRINWLFDATERERESV